MPSLAIRRQARQAATRTWQRRFDKHVDEIEHPTTWAHVANGRALVDATGGGTIEGMAVPIEYVQIFEHLPEAYVILDRDLRIQACNRAYERATRSRREDIIGRRMIDAFPHAPDQLENPNRRRLRESLERVLANRRADVIPLIEYRVPRDVGGALEERSWSATHVPIFDDAGEVAFIVQHTTDVTEVERLDRSGEMRAGVLGRARHAEHLNTRLHADLLYLRSLVDQAPGFVAVLRGPDHVFEVANRSLTRGLGGRSIIGKTVAEALPELVGQELMRALEHTYTTGEVYVSRNAPVRVRRGRSQRVAEMFLDVVFQPIVRDGAVDGVYVQGFDATAHLQLLEERRALVELIPAHVWTARPDGTLDFVNNHAVAFVGAPRSKLLDHGWTSYIADEDRAAVVDVWNRSLATGEPYEIQLRFRRHDGVRTGGTSAGKPSVPLRTQTGAISGWLGASVDIDDSRRAREKLEQRANYEKQLIAIVSHDLRNPLATISLGAELLRERPELTVLENKAISRIISATGRASRLVTDFLDLARARSGGIPLHPTPTDLRVLVEQLADELAPSHPGRVIQLELDPFELWSRCDGDRIAQVLGNLIINALEYGARDRPVRVAVHGVAHEVRISVHNEGPAIGPQELPHLFEPFWRGRSALVRGLGLGLYIAHEIVAAHGGELEVRSSAAHGTTFTIHLPRGDTDHGATSIVHA